MNCVLTLVRGSFRTGNGRVMPGRRQTKIAGRTASYRLVPLGTAWYRINFFLRAQNRGKRDARPHPANGFPSPPRVRFPIWDVRFAHCGPPGEGGARCRVLSKPWVMGAFQSPQGCSRWARVVVGCLLKRSLGGQRWDYAGGYAGLCGRLCGIKREENGPLPA
jgi:hypothetical protein